MIIENENSKVNFECINEINFRANSMFNTFDYKTEKARERKISISNKMSFDRDIDRKSVV